MLRAQSLFANLSLPMTLDLSAFLSAKAGRKGGTGIWGGPERFDPDFWKLIS